MKRLLPFAVCSLLCLGACSKEQPQHNESTELHEKEKATAGSTQGADNNLADPQIAAGEEVYEDNCAGCHNSGTAGAPKPGDKEGWKERIPLGIAELTKKSIEGYEGKTGMMPPKGGNSSLSEKEVSSAVKYMVFKSQ